MFNSDKICCSYYDFYFGVTFFGTHCICDLLAWAASFAKAKQNKCEKNEKYTMVN